MTELQPRERRPEERLSAANPSRDSHPPRHAPISQSGDGPGMKTTPFPPLRSLLLMTLLLLGAAAGVRPILDINGAQPDPDIEDLALIPANGQGFLSVRVADLWKTPAVQKGVADAKRRDPECEDPAVRIEKEFGLKPVEVERFSVVCSSDGLIWSIARTSKPYDRKKILSRLEGAKQAVHQGKEYYTVTDKQGRKAAAWLASPRVIVVGPEEGVKACIALAAAKVQKGPLQPIIALCKKKHHAVVGLDGKRLDGVKGNLLLSWVTPIRLAWATVDVDKEVELSIHALAADEKQAKRLHRNAAVGLLLTPEFLASKIQSDVAMALSSLMTGVKSRQDGLKVIARSKCDSSWLISTVVLAYASSMLDEDLILQVRSPFGVHRVEEGPTTKDGYRYECKRLVHGGTLHAKQLTGGVRELFRDPDTNKIVYGPPYFVPSIGDTPMAYYHRTGPVGQVFRAYNTDPKRAFAVLDLGAGTMAGYGLPGQTVDFYERDRDLARITFDTDEYFTFVENARRRGVDVNLVLGDPRSTFASKGAVPRLKPLQVRKGKPEPPRKYGVPIRADSKYRLILVDTLGPDSIPGHLTTRITREAVKGYFDGLDGDGIVLIQISSRHFDLLPVLANIADALGVVGYHLSDDDNDSVGKNRSHWVALTRKPEYMAKALTVSRWTRDPDQLGLLGVAAFPTGGSPALQAIAGMSHLGLALTDLQTQMAHKDEGRLGDPRSTKVEWEPLETTKELRRIESVAPKEIRDLTARIGRLKKERDESRRDSSRKTWLTDRIRSLEGARDALRNKLERSAEKIQRNAKVGVWTDDSSDLVELIPR